MTSKYKQLVGQEGENLAESYLKKNGFIIVSKNFRFKKIGEIDLIAQKNNLLLFVEVKNRKTNQYGGARYSLSSRKKRSFKIVANQFLNLNSEFNNTQTTCRFDLISIKNGLIEWIEDIFR